MSPNDPPINYDPQSHDSIDKILEARQKEQHRRELLKEEVADYTAALNRIFASPDGQYLLKKWMKGAGIFSFDNLPPDGRLAVEKGMRKFFLEFIWQYLEKTIKMESLS